jgi:hypothetical protein
MLIFSYSLNVLKTNKMKRLQTILILFFISVVVLSCKYDFFKKPEPINPGTPVKFATQILPIFSTDACTGCHKPGGQSPDYTPANAYASIISNNVVDTTNPASSLLYTVPNPTTSGHTWDKYTSQQAQLVLLWITQGAQNN